MARHLMTGPARLAALALVPGTFGFCAPAVAATQAGADVAVGATVQSNPYLNSGSGTDVAGTLQVDPWVRWLGETSSVNLNGDFLVRQYSKQANGTDTSASVNLSANKDLSPYVSIHGGGSYLTTRNGLNFFLPKAGWTDTLPPPTTPLPDVTLTGSKIRSQTFMGYAGMAARLSPLDTVSADFTASRSIHDGGIGADFTFLNGQISYARSLSERTSLTAAVRVGHSDYTGTRTGDGTIISPQVGFSRRLGPTLTLDLSAGASFTRTYRADGTIAKFTSFSGDAHLCRRREFTSICLTAARSAQPAALGGITTATNIAAAYTSRLSRRDSLGLNLGFSSNRDEGQALIVPLRSSRYYNATANWNRNFTRHFSGYVSPSYSHSTNSLGSYDNYQISAGLRYSFGATQ